MPEQTKGVVGGCKQFECKVIGFPRPSVRWYKDGVNITTDKRYKFDYTREGYVTLIIDNVTYKDQGAYQCQADNSEGRAYTSAYLLVRGKRQGASFSPRLFFNILIELYRLYTAATL
ncbi:hypothetical protein ACJMK2_014460 [Sinanodonta woodiana]|uniref:Ig-like domain-containing protein n=1 Tax=Sinanodonta woodiana TaxID=1069815 RepID=A0ABD3V0T8_SINWO